MREQSVPEKIWRILFPLLLYECLVFLIPKLLEVVSGGRLMRPGAAMWALTLQNLLMLPVFGLLYRQDRKNREQGRNRNQDRSQNKSRNRARGIRNLFPAVLGAVCISRGLNYFLALTPLPYYFPGYEAVSEEIYHSSLLSQIAASVIAAPLLEETLMRGVIYGRLKDLTENPRLAMVLSALLFGLFHGNVVQGLYAFVMGLFFAELCEISGSLIPAVLAHMAANGASVLAGQLHWADGVSRIPWVYYLLTAGFLLGGMFCRRCFYRNEERG